MFCRAGGAGKELIGGEHVGNWYLIWALMDELGFSRQRRWESHRRQRKQPDQQPENGKMGSANGSRFSKCGKPGKMGVDPVEDEATTRTCKSDPQCEYSRQPGEQHHLRPVSLNFTLRL